jgi:hypothetical protein
MGAAAESQPSEHEIVGHVFGKASPILTWRPAVSPPSITVPDPASSSDASGLRPSRATTKRMVAWPVLQQTARGKSPAIGALATLVALSLLCGSVLAAAIYVALGQDAPLLRANAAPTRAFTTHAMTATVDTLAAAPTPLPEATPIATPPPAPAAQPRAPAPATPTHRGAARRAHREAAPIHAARSAPPTGHAASGVDGRTKGPGRGRT